MHAVETDFDAASGKLRETGNIEVRTTTYIETADGECIIAEQALNLPTVLPLERGGWGGGNESGDVAALRAAQASPQAAREYMLDQGENTRGFGRYAAPDSDSSSDLQRRIRKLSNLRRAAAEFAA